MINKKFKVGDYIKIDDIIKGVIIKVIDTHLELIGWIYDVKYTYFYSDVRGHDVVEFDSFKQVMTHIESDLEFDLELMRDVKLDELGI